MNAREITKAAKKVNKFLASLPTYSEHIPLFKIFGALEQHGLGALQEDGCRWDGLICGGDGQIYFDLGDLDNPIFEEWGVRYEPINRVLALSWYKMASGRYEIISYVTM